MVSGDTLGTLLNDHRSLRLALLNACEGARTGADDPFAGVAQHLVLQGIPAIIAMQFEISDDAAIILAQEFYAALADGYPVEAALAEARKAIFVAGHEVELDLAKPGRTTGKTPDNNLSGRGEDEQQSKGPIVTPSPKVDSPSSTLVNLPTSPTNGESAPLLRRPAMLVSLLVGVALVGMIRFGPNLLPGLGSARTEPTAITAAVITTFTTEAVAPTTQKANQVAMNEAAIVATLLTTFTLTPEPTDTAIRTPQPTETPASTLTLTLAPGARYTLANFPMTFVYHFTNGSAMGENSAGNQWKNIPLGG